MFVENNCRYNLLTWQKIFTFAEITFCSDIVIKIKEWDNKNKGILLFLLMHLNLVFKKMTASTYSVHLKNITLTLDPSAPQCYIVKLGFSGTYILFLIVWISSFFEGRFVLLLMDCKILFWWKRTNAYQFYHYNIVEMPVYRGLYLSRFMTKPTKWLCAKRRLRSAWISAQSHQSLRCALSG